jgi:hypothetical protein
MQVFGWVAAIAGIALFVVALVRTLRANPDTTVPFSRNPAIIPPGSIAMQRIGVGLSVFGAAALTETLGLWSFALVLGAPVAAIAMIRIHNHSSSAVRSSTP